MTDTRRNPRYPRPLIDPGEIASHVEELDCASSCDRCRLAVTMVAADAVAMLIEIIRLSESLACSRLESANRLAAMNAALGAASDGEPDPLAYLRDQLAEEAASGAGSRR